MKSLPRSLFKVVEIPIGSNISDIDMTLSYEPMTIRGNEVVPYEYIRYELPEFKDGKYHVKPDPNCVEYSAEKETKEEAESAVYQLENKLFLKLLIGSLLPNNIIRTPKISRLSWNSFLSESIPEYEDGNYMNIICSPNRYDILEESGVLTEYARDIIGVNDDIDDNIVLYCPTECGYMFIRQDVTSLKTEDGYISYCESSFILAYRNAIAAIIVPESTP